MRVIATSPVHAARYYAVVRPTHLSEGAGPEKKGARLDKKKELGPKGGKLCLEKSSQPG